MGNGWRALRRRILTPDVSETSIEVRGFHRKNAESTELLETVGRQFLAGYGYAVEARTPAQAEEWLETVPARFRGFAYEGAGMGYAMLDGLPFGGRRRIAEMLATAAGQRHVYIIYVGVGWAMARLPRFRWPDPAEFDPLLRWLVLDGYGFHQAYFRTERYVEQQYVDHDFPWPGKGLAAQANRVIDQGIGRALWFVGGTDASVVADIIERFPESRQADLYAGAGLASTYACGADPDELRRFADRAGKHRRELAQGSAFAAEARVRAGLLIPDTGVATEILCGTGPEHAAEVTQRLLPSRPFTDGEVLEYQRWRQRIAEEFVTAGGIVSTQSPSNSRGRPGAGAPQDSGGVKA